MNISNKQKSKQILSHQTIKSLSSLLYFPSAYKTIKNWGEAIFYLLRLTLIFFSFLLKENGYE